MPPLDLPPEEEIEIDDDMENHDGNPENRNEEMEEMEQDRRRRNEEWERAAARVIPWIQGQPAPEDAFDPFRKDARAEALVVHGDPLFLMPYQGLALDNLNREQWEIMGPGEQEILMNALNGLVENEGLMRLCRHTSAMFFLSPDGLHWLCTSPRCRAQAGQGWILQRIHTVSLRRVERRGLCRGCDMEPHFSGGVVYCHDCAWTVLVHPEHIMAGRILRALPRILDYELRARNNLNEARNFNFPALPPAEDERIEPNPFINMNELAPQQESLFINVQNSLLLNVILSCCLAVLFFLLS